MTNNTASAETERSDPAQTPGSPNSLKVVRHERGKLMATWAAPDSGSDPTGYTLQWKEAGDGWETQDSVSQADVKGTSHLITGLTDGVEYAVRVIASKDDSESAPSGEVTATPWESTPPSPSSVSVNGATLTVTFDEALAEIQAPASTAFAVTVAGNSRGVSAVAVSGSAVTLTLVTAVLASEAVTMDYTVPTGPTADRLRDLAGNAAASFSGREATNNTAPAQSEESSESQDDTPNSPGNPESTDRSLTGRDAGLPESLAGVPAFAGRCRSEQARLGGAEGAVARVREACSGMLARASGPGRCCERASGRERYRP